MSVCGAILATLSLACGFLAAVSVLVEAMLALFLLLFPGSPSALISRALRCRPLANFSSILGPLALLRLLEIPDELLGHLHEYDLVFGSLWDLVLREVHPYQVQVVCRVVVEKPLALKEVLRDSKAQWLDLACSLTFLEQALKKSPCLPRVSARIVRLDDGDAHI